ncbi:HSF-type DNA-binding protein [Phlyctema vagabunda]|uniref:HSF-type DNA-binding protein n=1 Tax=Phlyctema vagabunda TaxID=108571 RepID=A0ABR4PCG3_9HELO
MLILAGNATMEISEDRAQRTPFMNHPKQNRSTPRTVPIHQPPIIIHTSAPSPGDPMETSSPGAAMGPPSNASMDTDTNGTHEHLGLGDQPSTGSLAGPSAAAAAAAGAQQPKVVQTAFIHKLYNMLEDQSIQHLISWSTSAESFVMSPSNDFSKVLSQYFKHTNISSFVRQLNMYGFHKVSDVFHTGAPDSPLWEFKHGNGSFKRGDLVGLREIKRRASRHALVHRDSYSAPKPPPSQPGTPAEPMHPMQDSTESRLGALEHHLYEMSAKMAKSEHIQHNRNIVIIDALSRNLQVRAGRGASLRSLAQFIPLHFFYVRTFTNYGKLNYELSKVVLSVVHNSDSPVYRDVLNIQAEIQRQDEIIRAELEPPEPPFSSGRPYFSNLSLDNPPVSPRQMPQDDPRRMAQMGPSRHNNYYRPPVPSNLSITPRRYGSIGGGGTTQSSPSSLRSQPPPPPPPAPHPLSSVVSPPMNLARRHTSADIRNVQGWQANNSPFASGQSSSQWPSSPKRSLMTMNEEDQRIRDSFSSYTLQSASAPSARNDTSRPTTPPPFSNGSNQANSMDHLNSWSWGSQNKGLSSSGGLRDNSGPPTRRGSMAHILNPAETAEREEEHEEEMREEDRKRKRIQ